MYNIIEDSVCNLKITAMGELSLRYNKKKMST